MSEVLSAHPAVSLLRRVHLPGYKPILRRLLLDPGTSDGSVVLLNVVLLDLPILLHLAHLFRRLDLKHANVFIFLLAPLGQGCLEAEPVVDDEHAVGGFVLSSGQMRCPLELIDADHCLR